MANSVEEKLDSVISPFQRFVRDESVSSVCLFFAAVLALWVANSELSEHYYELLHTPLWVAVGDARAVLTVHQLINDGLMAFFFFVLGLEIKRELLVGDLRDASRASPVLAAALGGMLVPALFYLLFNQDQSSIRGWGIPMATDSAFALGVLMLLGARAPHGLKAFLVAYAIIDDLGAILIIALFYTDALDTSYLMAAAASLFVLAICNLGGVRNIGIFLGVGVLLWICLMGAGVHGTVAGVLVALAVPARPKKSRKWFIRRARRLVKDVERLQGEEQFESKILANPKQHEAVEAVEQAAKLTTTPLKRWERALGLPVLWVILPLFALANAGIPLGAGQLLELIGSPVGWGIVSGLVVGKVLGISLFTWFSLKLGLGRLPDEVTMAHVIGVGLLGGMGFTMSIFIAGLTFHADSELYLAKAAILFASLLAGVGGYLWLRLFASRYSDVWSS